MTILWRSVPLLLVLYSIDVHAEIKLPSFGNRTFVHQGSDITLPWTYTFDVKSVFSRQWQFSKTGKTADFQSLVQISADQDPVIAPGTFSGMSVTKPATLILKNASVNHSGTYRFEIRLNAGANPPPSDIMVIIPVRPTIDANCSGTKTLKEGENIYCSCKGINGNPPAIAFWSKNGQPYGERGDLMQTLVLSNVGRSDSGTYKCTVRSYNLEDSKSFTLEVQYKPIIEPLEDKVAILGSSVTISCKADGVPEPKYIIVHNNTKVTDGKEYTIDNVGGKHAGLYTCTATNFLGSDSKSFSLTVKVLATHTTTPSVGITTKQREKLICDKGTEWYVSLITFICGMIVGMVLLYAIMWLRLRLSKKTDQSIPSQQGDHAGPSGEGLENASTYQELDLQKMNKSDDNYQSLRMTSRNARSNAAPVEIENEAGYQELNEVRGNTDDNYQPLNRV